MRQTLGRRGAAVESPQFVGRLQAEGDDVLSALEFIRTLPFVDQRRLGIMGWSFGGIVTMFRGEPQQRLPCRGGPGGRCPHMGRKRRVA